MVRPFYWVAEDVAYGFEESPASHITDLLHILLPYATKLPILVISANKVRQPYLRLDIFIRGAHGQFGSV